MKITIIDGNSKAFTEIIKHNVSIKFENSTPKFSQKVVEMIDTFIHSDIEHSQKNLEHFRIDWFERGK